MTDQFDQRVTTKTHHMTDHYEPERRKDSCNDHSIRIALLEQSMKNISSELHDINRSIGWIVKMFGGALFLAVMKFVISGGLA